MHILCGVDPVDIASIAVQKAGVGHAICTTSALFECNNASF